MRRFLLSTGIESLYHCGLVFEAAVSAMVLVVLKDSRPRTLTAYARREDEMGVLLHDCDYERFRRDPRQRFLIHASDREASFLERVADFELTIRDHVKISRGEEIGKKHVAPDGEIPILVGSDIGRYSLARPTRYIATLAKREEIYSSPKIVMVKTGDTCIACLDSDALATMQSVYNLHPRDGGVSLHVVLALLNSRFVAYYIRKTFTSYKLLFPQLNQSTVYEIPVPNDVTGVRESIEGIVESMLDLHQRLATTRTSDDRTRLERRIAATDRRIDRLVYELYALTDEEIAIVEKSRG